MFDICACVDRFLGCLVLYGWVDDSGGVMVQCLVVRQLFWLHAGLCVCRGVIGVLWRLGWMFSSGA